jgi:hypothetical protein
VFLEQMQVGAGAFIPVSDRLRGDVGDRPFLLDQQ